jgi:LuxR family maltose regulon positive regulatory protein
MRALLCRDGVAAMRTDAEAASAAMRPGSPWRWAALVLEGASHLLEGHDERADPILAHAFDIAVDVGGAPTAAAALAFRAVVAIDRHRWDDAEALLDVGVDLVRSTGIEDYVETSLLFALAARAAVRRGDHAAAHEQLTRANRLRARLNYAVPFHAVLTRLHLASAYLELGDAGGARVVMREVHDVLQQRPRLGVLTEQIRALQAVVDGAGTGVVGASSLTAAELRLVPYLQTHLSFREIADRLFVSRHTIKTQAISIYRKLGVSSRSDAIARMQTIGLIDDT